MILQAYFIRSLLEKIAGARILTYNPVTHFLLPEHSIPDRDLHLSH